MAEIPDFSKPSGGQIKVPAEKRASGLVVPKQGLMVPGKEEKPKKCGHEHTKSAKNSYGYYCNDCKQKVRLIAVQFAFMTAEEQMAYSAFLQKVKQTQDQAAAKAPGAKQLEEKLVVLGDGGKKPQPTPRFRGSR